MVNNASGRTEEALSPLQQRWNDTLNRVGGKEDRQSVLYHWNIVTIFLTRTITNATDLRQQWFLDESTCYAHLSHLLASVRLLAHHELGSRLLEWLYGFSPPPHPAHTSRLILC